MSMVQLINYLGPVLGSANCGPRSIPLKLRKKPAVSLNFENFHEHCSADVFFCDFKVGLIVKVVHNNAYSE